MSGLADLFGSGVGSAIGGGFGTAMDVWKMGRASDEAEFARDWSAQQYAKRYQVSVADMKAAGLNPLLAVAGGSVSGQPTGSPAEVPDVENPVSSAFELARRRKELALMDSQIDKTNAEANLTKKTMPPADPWRLLLDFLQSNGWLTSAKSSSKGLVDYVKDTVKTFPMIPSAKPYRQPLQAITPEQREQLQRKGFYYRYPNKR